MQYKNYNVIYVKILFYHGNIEQVYEKEPKECQNWYLKWGIEF